MIIEIDMDLSFSDMAEATLNDTQRALLAAQPDVLRAAVYQRIEASLRVSAKLQLASCYQLGISTFTFERVIREEHHKLAAEFAHQDLMTRLVAGGASFTVLHTLCNMDKATFTRIRHALGLKVPPSRKSIDDATSVSIYRDWELMKWAVTPESLLQLHESSGASINAIWSLLQDWQYVQAKMARR